MVLYLENHREYTCLTGSILIRPDKIEKYKSFKSRLFRRIEFAEYAQAFLAGRNFASETNSMYTLSGAFSAFRMSSIRKSHLYNTETISEDTEITFQMRYIQKQKVGICVDAIYFTDPIEGVNKLYRARSASIARSAASVAWCGASGHSGRPAPTARAAARSSYS